MSVFILLIALTYSATYAHLAKLVKDTYSLSLVQKKCIENSIKVLVDFQNQSKLPDTKEIENNLRVSLSSELKIIRIAISNFERKNSNYVEPKISLFLQFKNAYLNCGAKLTWVDSKKQIQIIMDKF